MVVGSQVIKSIKLALHHEIGIVDYERKTFAFTLRF